MQGSIIRTVLLAFLFCNIISPAAAAPPDSAFQKRIAGDTRALIIFRDNLRRVADFTRSRPDLFSPDKEQGKMLLAREDKLAIWNTWSTVLDSLAALDEIRREQGAFHLFQDKERRNASFALTNAAFLAGYRYALELIAQADRNPALDTVLNEAVPELGIPSGTFGRFKFRFLNVAVATEFAALQVIDTSYANGPRELRAAMDEDSRAIWEMGKGKGHALTLKNALAVVRTAGFTAWFPLQKGVSEWMGDTKVLRKGSHLISARQIEAVGKRLQPGDIIFERHEWFLSNLGLPGFWTHVALYIGTPEERRRLFNDAGVKAWVTTLGIANGDFETLLRQRYPTAYGKSLIPREDSHPTRILEAISEGVSFTSLEYTGSADSIGVIRPRLSKRDKAQAILRAFHYSGRPYDFNFDFETDAALVCSELIFKAYEPGGGMKGLRFPVTEVVGRKVSTPNNMVRQFDEQLGTAGAQADFVLFLDGFEKEKRAVESTAEQFRASWQRPNWHILIQDTPVEAGKK
ncbi:hypothetical protein FO488_12130 [Geobacter sp. FeAm09]|uniref:YiiX/YebB-like N1pC/P60 family cysteine hydrolase n=1 Tax=Geobacter sp. FeAm09 TaxID=2597769 RepID=UPI0011ED4236|nr:YiiX/YebB-like N1pC/P60 family cysteine hydrolase [Geobacter sp. FeAm09]QEM68832.1 hypothetical protein FO488_12130 [Geobacter sp. FeAm09]